MIAAGHTGANASSRLHRGRGHYLNPRKNHLAAKYIATSAMTAAPAIQHHIRNSFAFSPRATDSNSQSLRFAAATVRATSSSTRRTPASVPGRVRLVDQL